MDSKDLGIQKDIGAGSNDFNISKSKSEQHPALAKPQNLILLSEKAEILKKKSANILSLLPLEPLKKELDSLHILSQNKDIWQNQQKLSAIQKQIKQIESQTDLLNKANLLIEDIDILLEFLNHSSDDPDLLLDCQNSLSNLESILDALELKTLFCGKYDAYGAILTIRQGVGGDDAADWAAMLLDIYQKWLNAHDFSYNIIDISLIDAGLKSAIIEIPSKYAYGYLSSENGTHRLARISPFNAQGKRQTSFASVEVTPIFDQIEEIEIDAKDIKIDVYRSSGPGGQSVNTTDSAVRINHIPTGIVVAIQNEKSQLQNKNTALKILKSKLLYLEKQKQSKTLKEIAGDIKASWGQQIRNYVLYGSKIIKDTRSGHSVSNIDKVLNGDIDGFIKSYLIWRNNRQKA